MSTNLPYRWSLICLIGLVLILSGCGQRPSDVQPDTGASTAFPTADCPGGSLADSFSKIEPGAARPEVIDCLGRPTTVNEYRLPGEPFYGPGEGLASILEPDTPLEEWVYEADDQVYYIWFAGKTDEPQDRWQVALTATYPAGAVF